MTNNKIPQEIEEKHKGNICCQGCYKLGLLEGKRQKADEVLKLIDELQIKYPNFALILDKLKAGVKNGKED
jgi:hypothetical protein